MKLKIGIFFFIFISINCSINAQIPWTWSYRKKIPLNEAEQLTGKPNIIFSKVDVPSFNQLIFSWNALRPKKGYFRFWVKPRYASNKEWGKWYKMFDWGNGVQQSYSDIAKNDTSYVYVRLEISPGKLADGFKLKVEPKNNANLADLRMLGVSISDFSKFKIEKVQDLLNLESVEIKNVPKKSQMILDHIDNQRMCSPTSISMMVSHFCNTEINIVDFAKRVYDKGLDSYGSWPFNTAAAYELCPGYYFRVVRLNSFIDLHANLMRGYPVVISVRGKISGAPKDYNHGHLILVTGFDKNNREVIVNDPAFPDNCKVKRRYDITSLARAWERSHRIAYIIDRR
ncbi:MAG: C39 family peptidase [Candidatus Babeliales bacterium]|nr:C39 family peptidase [Candidatus Babeliales bacterium]